MKNIRKDGILKFLLVNFSDATWLNILIELIVRFLINMLVTF